VSVKAPEPQENKVLDYERDRRYSYGNSNKAARKGVPWRKAWVNRTYRRRARQVVQLSDPEEIGTDIGVTRESWSKASDIPLALHVDSRWRIRQQRGGNDPSRSPLRDEAARRVRRGGQGFWFGHSHSDPLDE
jgi:hypothetical protein